MKNVRILNNQEIKEVQHEINWRKENMEKINKWDKNSTNFDRKEQILNSHQEIVDRLEDELLINQALGLVNLRMCQVAGIKFDRLAQAINRQRK